VSPRTSRLWRQAITANLLTVLAIWLATTPLLWS
jgi:hypothetical protein